MLSVYLTEEVAKLFIGYSVIYKVWKLTNSILILLFLFLFLGIWTLQVHLPFSMFLNWNMLLLFLYYTMFYVLSTTLLQILLYLYDTFTERLLHNHLKTPFFFAAFFFFKDSNLVYCALKDIFPLNLSSVPSKLILPTWVSWILR